MSVTVGQVIAGELAATGAEGGRRGRRVAIVGQALAEGKASIDQKNLAGDIAAIWPQKKAD